MMSNRLSSEDRSGSYLLNHWRGVHSLSRSYWLNGTLIVLLITLVPLWAAYIAEARGASLQLISTFSLTAILMGLASWLWGIVGIWRSASHHVERGGVAAWSKLACAMVILGAVATAGQAGNIFRQSVEYAQLALGGDSFGKPAKITLMKGDILEIGGALSQGTAARFSDALELAPNVKTVVLNSVGGRLLEADRMANMIKARHLDTVAKDKCLSACVMALLAGTKRTANFGARIGLHQPTFPGQTQEEHDDAIAAQRQFYLNAGVRADFVERAMKAVPTDMWYPTEDELLSAGVLTGINVDHVKADNAASAAELNKKAPIRIDDITEMSGAKADGMTLTYRYKVKAKAEQLDLQLLHKELLKANAKELCSRGDIRRMIAAGGVYRYEYGDEVGAPLTQFSINKC